jgi:hypothetical protein
MEITSDKSNGVEIIKKHYWI